MTKCVIAIAVVAAGPLMAVGSVSEDVIVARAATDEQAMDCRPAFPVLSLDDDPALAGIRYSAIGWGLTTQPDANRTVSIVARPGTFSDGVFSPDAVGELTVLSGATGTGTCSWAPTAVSKKIYRLEHTVYNQGAADASGTLYGYMDFTRCVSWASQADVERAVLGSVTHPIEVLQDVVAPWQPIDTSATRAGIATDVELATETVTATTFAFSGRGTFSFEYKASHAGLSVWLDGVKVSDLAGTSEWMSRTLSIDDFCAHEVVVSYTVTVGEQAALRNVVWREPADGVVGRAARADVQADFQEGVRTPIHLYDVLPFAYSSTNWLGDVAGATGASVAQVSVVRLTGTDPCVTNWTEEVAGTLRVLRKEVGEGRVTWRARTGVWKATFDILDGEQGVRRETALFDLREAKGTGLVFSVE